MNESALPKTYEEWRHYITVKGGLELTPDYVSERIASLKNDQDLHTQQFVKLYGEEYLQKVLGWFEQARNM